MAGEKFDTTDVDRWIGVPLGGAYLKDPVAPNDVRRGPGDAEPEPLTSRPPSQRGPLRAPDRPQSFAICTDDSHGRRARHPGAHPRHEHARRREW